MKKYTIADQIDVITNFTGITNVVIKRAHCTSDYCRNKTSFFLIPMQLKVPLNFFLLLSDTMKYPAASFWLTEMIIVLLFIVVWLLSIVCFLWKWNKFRLMRPVGSFPVHSPRNMTSVAVVKKTEESVIYCK